MDRFQARASWITTRAIDTLNDVLDAVRVSRFRPKFVDGQAVATPGITYREVFWTAKPRE